MTVNIYMNIYTELIWTCIQKKNFHNFTCGVGTWLTWKMYDGKCKAKNVVHTYENHNRQTHRIYCTLYIIGGKKLTILIFQKLKTHIINTFRRFCFVVYLFTLHILFGWFAPLFDLDENVYFYWFYYLKFKSIFCLI